MNLPTNRRHPGRAGYAWEQVRKLVLANASHCAVCGRPLNADAPPRSRWSSSIDHILPLKAMRALDGATQRRLALDPANLRAVHLTCNSRRGAQRTPKPRRTSREW
jgi:5-methylcytosine-specific restriction endonuclease McrA